MEAVAVWGLCDTLRWSEGKRNKEKVTVLVNVWGIEASDIVLWLIMRRCHYVDFE